MAQLAELIWVLLEMSLEFLALDKLLADFTGPGFLDREPRYHTQGIGHSVPEGVDLFHFEMVRFHLLPELGLPFDDLCENGLVVPCCRERRGLVLPELVGWDDKRKRHAGFACSARAANSMGVGFGSRREIKVEDACHVLEIDTT